MDKSTKNALGGAAGAFAGYKIYDGGILGGLIGAGLGWWLTATFISSMPAANPGAPRELTQAEAERGGV